MKALLLINANARKGDEDDEFLVGLFDGSNIDVSKRIAHSEEEAKTIFQLLIADHDMVILAGGDGTISCLLSDILASGKPLGILPLGTGNDFARSIGVSEDLKDAAELIKKGSTRNVDVGYADGKPFLNALNIGFAEQIARDHGGLVKKTFGSLSYPYRWWRSYHNSKTFTADVVMDKEKHNSFRADQISVANSNSFGRHLTIDSENSLNSGELSVMAVKPIGLIGWIKLLPKMLFGDPETLEGVATSRERSISIVTRPKQKYTIDGEPAGKTPVDVKVQKGHLEVFAS